MTENKVSIPHARPPQPPAAASLHVAHPQQGHKSRAEGAARAVAEGLPLPGERPQPAWDAGHRARQIPQRHLRERLLLARARGLPKVHGPQEQRRVLEGEGRPQPGA